MNKIIKSKHVLEFSDGFLNLIEEYYEKYHEISNTEKKQTVIYSLVNILSNVTAIAIFDKEAKFELIEKISKEFLDKATAKAKYMIENPEEFDD